MRDGASVEVVCAVWLDVSSTVFAVIVGASVVAVGNRRYLVGEAVGLGSNGKEAFVAPRWLQTGVDFLMAFEVET